MNATAEISDGITRYLRRAPHLASSLPYHSDGP